MKGLCELKFVSEQVSFLILQTEIQTEGIYVMSANFNLEKRIVERLIVDGLLTCRDPHLHRISLHFGLLLS